VASGDTLLILRPLDAELPATGYPQHDVRNNHPVLDYQDAADETAYFTAVLPRHYAGGGITVTLHVAATSATSGISRWLVAWERLTAQDTDSDGFATANSVGITTGGTSGVPATGTIAFTDGAQMDATAAGELFRLSVARDGDGTSGTDSMTGDAELFLVELRET
jgi:hypothetical protein